MAGKSDHKIVSKEMIMARRARCESKSLNETQKVAWREKSKREKSVIHSRHMVVPMSAQGQIQGLKICFLNKGP